jgi:hypothetical protein
MRSVPVADAFLRSDSGMAIKTVHQQADHNTAPLRTRSRPTCVPSSVMARPTAIIGAMAASIFCSDAAWSDTGCRADQARRPRCSDTIPAPDHHDAAAAPGASRRTRPLLIRPYQVAASCQRRTEARHRHLDQQRALAAEEAPNGTRKCPMKEAGSRR